jgi:hypothetical protein
VFATTLKVIMVSQRERLILGAKRIGSVSKVT